MRAQVTHKSGFTLIELSIVLVIIGLLVGGILVGGDMIQAAELRATLAQYEKFNTAVNTFREKYKAVPGDMAPVAAAAYGLFTLSNPPLVQTFPNAPLGNNNGLVESGIVSMGAQARPDGETLVFWRHLTETELIDGSYGLIGRSDIRVDQGTIAGTPQQFQIGLSLPPAKMGRGNYFAAYSSAGVNYYELNGIAQIGALGTYLGTARLTPLEAFSLDSKIDDGMPNSGNVIARGDPAASLNRPAGATCMAGNPGVETYLLTATAAACGLRFRFN